MLRSIILVGSLINSVALPSLYAADDGWTSKELFKTNIPLELNLKKADVRCTEMDSWGQSDLVVKIPPYTPKFGKEITSVSKLFDGPCNQEATRILAEDKLNAELQVTVSEYIEWGVVSAGTDHAEPYCKKHIKQMAFLVGDNPFEFPYYQAGGSIKTEKLSYSYCQSLTQGEQN